MAYIYPFRGQWPDIDPGAYLADNVTVIGKVIIKKRCQSVARRRRPW